MKSKACTKCGRVLPMSAFGNHRISKDGKAHRCKECARTFAKIWNNTASGIYSRLMSRTKHYGTKPFKLDRGEFIGWHNSQEKRCYYCSIPEELLYLLEYHFRKKSSRLTVDCKDNDAGYFIDNLVLACYRCNFMKSDILTAEEMREFGQKYIRPKWEACLKIEGR